MHLHLPDPMPAWPGGRLREWRIDDASRLVAAWTDPEIARWNPVPADPSIERARSWITSTTTRLEAGRALDLCIVGDRDDRVVGEVGLSGVDRARRGALIGYWLLDEARGAGLASAALAALTSAAHGFGLRALVARCATDNLASQRVASRAGYVHARNDGQGHELWVHRA